MMSGKPNPKSGTGSRSKPSKHKSTSNGNSSIRRTRANSRGSFQIEEAADHDNDLKHKFRKNLHTLSGTLFSFVVHSIVLFALAWLVFTQRESTPSRIVAEIVAKPEAVESPAKAAPVVIEIQNDELDQSILESESTENALSDQAPFPTIADSDDPESADQTAPIKNNLAVAPVAASIIGGGLEGRNSGSRSSLAAQMGGTAQSEMAVENGLKWLANHQHADGSWRLDFTKSNECNGQCNDPGTRASTTAATGLSLMAFLGAGYTHKTGPYQEEVNAGLEYLKSRMRKTYFGGNLAEGTMYAQGISTIALSEAYSMTRDPDLLETVKSAMEYIVTAQHSAGGWRYSPGEPGDTTVTGWQVMALKSCQMAGIDVPMETIKKAKKYLASVGDESAGSFGYQSKENDPTSTAIGLLLQIYLGWGREHRGLNEGSNLIAQIGPSKNNIYFNYYATLLMFHSRHEHWDSWNQQMRDFLVQTQAQTSHEAGSWFFKERYGSVGGRLYTTAMAIMILEVYYRYLPLFDSEAVYSRR